MKRKTLTVDSVNEELRRAFEKAEKAENERQAKKPKPFMLRLPELHTMLRKP